jgi:hypothetical protein
MLNPTGLEKGTNRLRNISQVAIFRITAPPRKIHVHGVLVFRTDWLS